MDHHAFYLIQLSYMLKYRFKVGVGMVIFELLSFVPVSVTFTFLSARHLYQNVKIITGYFGWSGMSIFRFLAEFCLYFGAFYFFSNDFPLFFLKSPKEKIYRSLTLPLLGEFDWPRAALNSRWRLRLLVYASSVSGQSSKASYQHAARRLAAGWLKRKHWCLNSWLFWSLTCYLLSREEGGEGGA